MADLTDVVLNVGGWIVAALVTVVGIIVAQRSQNNSRQKQEDQAGIYEPFHREVVRVLGQREMLLSGDLVVWLSDEFQNIVARGALWPKRHSDLRRDVEFLKTLVAKHEKSLRFFLDADASREMRKVWNEAYVTVEGNNRSFSEILSNRWQELRLPLGKGQKEVWVQSIDGMVHSWNTSGEPMTFISSLSDLYDEARKAVVPSWDAHKKDSEALIGHFETMKSRLEVALSNESAYRIEAPVLPAPAAQ